MHTVDSRRMLSHPFHCWAVLKSTPEESDDAGTPHENRPKVDFPERFNSVISPLFRCVSRWFSSSGNPSFLLVLSGVGAESEEC